MSDDPRLQRLLDEMLDTDATPEEVCADCPELLATVRERWLQMRRVRAELDALFPTPAPIPAESSSDNDLRAPGTLPTISLGGAAGLPQVPGYAVEAILGRGGMGVVFRARHLRLNRVVALKMILAGAYASPRERERFQREAEAVAGLRHPNIVQIYDIGDSDGRPYYTMEYVERESLAHRLAGTPLPARQAAALLATLAQAMQAAHAQGIIHRDLKPSNILFTAEGTPKISDFGLARRRDDAELTQSGTPLGTPSYMAPEQAEGKRQEVGPAVDVYALGAILYECLTGRPPFLAATAAETLRQVVSQEPVPPSRLNQQVPRDLETICLKCLQKNPASRYASAQELADDLHRFLDGKPVLARPVGLLGRLGRWLKRHPLETALVVLVVLLILGGIAWLWWSDRQATMHRSERQQQEDRTRRGAEGALQQVRSLRDQARWPQARKALEQVELLVGHEGLDDLEQRVGVTRRDLRTAEELERIMQLKETIFDKALYEAPIPASYLKAFRDHGIDILKADPADLVKQIGNSEIKQQLLVALDHWAPLETDEAIQERLMRLARAVDPDPWRDRVRNPAAWKNTGALMDLAVQAPMTEQPVALLVALGARLPVVGTNTLSSPCFAGYLVTAPNLPGGLIHLVPLSALAPVTVDSVAFLERVQREYPDDFWANFALGNALLDQHPGDALAYFRAAHALRPQAVAVHNNLFLALRAVGRGAQGIDLLERALRISPRDPGLRSNLGLALVLAGKPAAAIEHYELAMAEVPQSAMLHNNLAIALEANNQLDKAIEEYREAIRLREDALFHRNLARAQHSLRRLDKAIEHYAAVVRLRPSWAAARVEWGLALQQNGQWKEAVEQFRLALQYDPWDAKTHFHLGNALMQREQTDEALGCFTRALQLDPRLPQAHYGMGAIAKAQGRLHEAVAFFQQAIQLEPNIIHPHFDLAGTLKDLGRYDEAAEHYQQASRIDPRQANCQGSLAQVLVAAGRFREARTAAQRCLDLLPRGDPRRPMTERLVQHCEGLMSLEARLPAILEGKLKLASAADSAQLGEICRIKKRNVAAARYYAAALKGAPEFFEDPRSARRYLAACAATLAGSASDEEGAKLDEDERARWRKEARAWLRADLAAWSRMLDRDPAVRLLLQKTLIRWQSDPDLAGLRDPPALDQLPPNERDECRALWDDVRALWRRAQAARPE
jgi:serine/threonine-protein kinase